MMKKRGAHFDTLLRIRRRQEDLKARDLAVARRNVAAAENEQGLILEAQRRMLEDVRHVTRDELDAPNAIRFRQHERHLARLAVEKDAVIGELKVKAEEKRTNLETAMKHRRMVEKLVDRRAAAFQTEFRKAEQKATDEVAVNKSAMKRGGERS